MTGVIDYGAGNLRSVQAALGRLGAAWRTVARPEELDGIAGALLPGVGQFGAAAHRLREAGLLEALRRFIRSGRPFLGICLGMQLLFEGSDEDPAAEGLGILRGSVKRLRAERVPHIVWALVEPRATGEEAPIFRGLPSAGFFAYFAHSYAVPSSVPWAAAVTSCPPPFASAVRSEATWGVQFHPEKSGADGERVLANFLAGAGLVAGGGRERDG